MEALKQLCEKWLCTKAISARLVANLLELADEYQASKLKAACINFIHR